MDVELRHLRWFLVLAGELHYGRAAARVHISQPTLSKAIQRLEAAVGVDLFERDHRGVALTPAGAAFAVSAELSVRAADDAVTAARSAVPGPSVRIGYGVAFDVLTRVLQRVAEGDPGLRVEPVSYLYRDLSAGLGSGEADIAFTMPYLDLPGIDFLPLGAEERVLLVPEGHPAAAAPVSLDTLRALLDAETWLLPSSDPPVGSTGYRRFWAGLDQLGGPEPPVTVTVGSNEGWRSCSPQAAAWRSGSPASCRGTPCPVLPRPRSPSCRRGSSVSRTVARLPHPCGASSPWPAAFGRMWLRWEG